MLTGNVMIPRGTENLSVLDSACLPILTPLSFISIHAALQWRNKVMKIQPESDLYLHGQAWTRKFILAEPMSSLICFLINIFLVIINILLLHPGNSVGVKHKHCR